MPRRSRSSRRSHRGADCGGDVLHQLLIGLRRALSRRPVAVNVSNCSVRCNMHCFALSASTERHPARLLRSAVPRFYVKTDRNPCSARRVSTLSSTIQRLPSQSSAPPVPSPFNVRADWALEYRFGMSRRIRSFRRPGHPTRCAISGLSARSRSRSARSPTRRRRLRTSCRLRAARGRVGRHPSPRHRDPVPRQPHPSLTRPCAARLWARSKAPIPPSAPAQESERTMTTENRPTCFSRRSAAAIALAFMIACRALAGDGAHHQWRCRRTARKHHPRALARRAMPVTLKGLPTDGDQPW